MVNTGQEAFSDKGAAMTYDSSRADTRNNLTARSRLGLVECSSPQEPGDGTPWCEETLYIQVMAHLATTQQPYG
jgi:hypothetical protein